MFVKLDNYKQNINKATKEQQWLFSYSFLNILVERITFLKDESDRLYSLDDNHDNIIHWQCFLLLENKYEKKVDININEIGNDFKKIKVASLFSPYFISLIENSENYHLFTQSIELINAPKGLDLLLNYYNLKSVENHNFNQELKLNLQLEIAKQNIQQSINNAYDKALSELNLKI